MKIVKRVALALAAIVLVLLAVSLFLPSGWAVERSVRINAPAAAIFPYVNSLKQWPAWTVWYEREPNLRVEYAGAEAGVGAISRWAGKDGEGEMTITASAPDQTVRYDLNFSKGEFLAHGEIRLTTNGPATTVHWKTHGDAGMNPVAKYFALFMDGLMGDDYQQGLTKLKNLLEKPG